MSKRANPRLIGAFVLMAIALAVVGAVVFGSGRFFRKTTKAVVYFDGSVAGLNVGAPVKFKGVEIGDVKEVLFNITGAQRALDDFRIIAIIEVVEDRVIARGGDVDFDNPAVLDSLIDQGLRAQLATESLVTGRKYVELDIYPGAPVHLEAHPGVPYPEIPTVRTGLEELETHVQEVISQLGALDLKTLVATVTQTVDGLNQIVHSPGLRGTADSLYLTLRNIDATLLSLRDLVENVDTSVVPLHANLAATAKQARATMHEAEATAASLRTLLEPGSPLTYQLERTLADLSAAGQALRAFAEYMERNPSALVRGKPEPKDQP